jgi:FkbM family methyltransferase
MLDVQQRRYLLNLILQAGREFKVKRIVCETNHGDFMVDVRDTDIGHSLLTQGEYGYSEMRRFFDYVPVTGGDGGFIDIGANIGTTCIPLALDATFASITAFEPDPYNFHLLEYNIGTNKMDRVIRPLNFAVGSKVGTVEFELSADNFGDHRVHYGELGSGSYNEGGRQRITVNSTTLDAMVETSLIDISKLRLIKSDTQGSEGHVMKGARLLLARRMVPWVIEFWPYGLDRSGVSREEICTLVKDNFSSFVELRQDGTVQKGDIGLFPELFSRYSGVQWCNLILFP